MALIHATRASALVGTPFRAQGRQACHGLDCIGLALTVYRLPLDTARDDYRLRGHHRAELEAAISTGFRRIGRKRARPGDLLLMQVAADQFHLAVLTGQGFVHADARLRCVVEVPGRPSWPVLRAFRRRQRSPR